MDPLRVQTCPKVSWKLLDGTFSALQAHAGAKATEGPSILGILILLAWMWLGHLSLTDIQVVVVHRRPVFGNHWAAVT